MTVLKKEEIPAYENEHVAYQAQQFTLDEVKVTDDYYLNAQESDIAFLKTFDVNRMLYNFRDNAGLKADINGATRYNGWENGNLAGHSVGHYLTAAAQAVMATKDES